MTRNVWCIIWYAQILGAIFFGTFWISTNRGVACLETRAGQMTTEAKQGVLNYVVDCCLKPICFNFVNVKLSNIRSECWCLINLIMPNSLYQLFLDIFGLTISRYFWSYLCMSFLLSNSLNPGLICFRKIDQ